MAKIYIDPGHGGSDSGAVANGVVEKEINLRVAKAARDLLSKAGHTVRMSRTSDTFLSLRERACASANWPANVFVSIHHDASGDPDTGGTWAFYDNEGAPNGKRLAGFLSNRIALQFDIRDLAPGGRLWGWPTPKHLGVLSNCQNWAKAGAASLVECCFLTNPTQAGLTKREDYVPRVAGAIANAVHDYLGVIPIPVPTPEPDEGHETPDPQEPSAWAEAAVAWAVGNGISDGTDPRRAATREEVLTMIYRAAAK